LQKFIPKRDYTDMDMGTLNFNYFDAIVIAVTVILGIKGLMNGFIKEFFGLVGIVGGVYIASRVADKAGDFISKNIYQIDNSAALQLIGFASVLAIVWILTVMIGSLFSSLTQMSGFGTIDRFLGFVVGGGKYFIIFALITTALSNITLAKDNLGKYFDNSLLYPYLKETGSYLINIDVKQFSLGKSSINTADQNQSQTP
jgi:membrane protein required for colicin V production